MMNKNTVSVIVPIYNAEKYLDKCVESIVSQTYKNLEIILVDDGSPDNCPKMCDEWAKKDDRIKVIHKKNGGVSSARNVGLDNANGEYVTFVDADDWCENDMIEMLASGDFDVSICGFYFDTRDGEEKEDSVEEKVFYNNDEILYNYLLDKIRPEIAAKLIKRSVIGNIRLNENIRYAEDLLFNYFVFKKAKRACINARKKYHYVQDNSESATSKYITDDRVNGCKVFKIIIQNEKNSCLEELAIRRYIRGLYAVITRIVKCEDNYFFDRYFDELRQEVLNYKCNILCGNDYNLKQKFAALLLMVSPSIFVKITKKL